MANLLLLAHGFPPNQIAGTERYTQRVAVGMARRGWQVSVVAATRSPGHAHGEVLREEAEHGLVVRVVNNLPWRPLGDEEHNPIVCARVRALVRELQPELVHINHLLFLSPRLRFPCPTLLTLHDAWGWCARGGSLLHMGQRPCPGPSPARCAPCYADFSKGSGREHKLANAAGRLGQVVDPGRLQALWKRVPARLRARARGSTPSLTSEEDVKRRQMAVKAVFQRMDLRVAPSRFLASLAENQDMGAVQHLPHGVPLPSLPEWPREGLLFLGTLAPHKGPDLVLQACEQLGLRSSLRLVGPAVDPNFQATLPADLMEPPLPPDQVPERLRRSRLLILGSRWPENAPLVILEARAQGTPIVAPRIGGIPELLEEGVDGLLYKAGDTQDCARAIQQALEQDFLPRLPSSQEAHLDLLECHYNELLV